MQTNKEMTFQWEEDTEKPNRGWVVHKLSAFVAGALAGYLKIAYIPQANFEKFYPKPAIIPWMTQMAGHHIALSGSLDEQLMGLSRTLDQWHEWLVNDRSRLDGLTDAEKQQMRRGYVQKAKRQFGARFKSFTDYHLDKPYVDWIHMKEEFAADPGLLGAMYLAAARQMNEQHGLRLYDCSTQTELHDAAFKTLDGQVPIKTEVHDGKLRRYIDLRDVAAVAQ